MNVGLLLYIMYFPVYNKEGDYNNFTSAHSWPVLTLGICDALFLYKRPGLGLCFLLLDFFFFSFTDVTALIRGPKGFRCSWRCRLFPQPLAAQTCVRSPGRPRSVEHHFSGGGKRRPEGDPFLLRREISHQCSSHGRGGTFTWQGKR